MNNWQQLHDLEPHCLGRVIISFPLETLSKAFYSCPDEVFEKMLDALTSNGQKGKQKAYLLQDHMQIIGHQQHEQCYEALKIILNKLSLQNEKDYL